MRGTMSVTPPILAPTSAWNSIVATSPSSAGDQNMPKRAVSFAIVLAGIGPNTSALGALPEKRTDKSGSVAETCSATRNAAASGETICSFAARVPSASVCQGSDAMAILCDAAGMLRPYPIASGRPFAPLASSFCVVADLVLRALTRLRSASVGAGNAIRIAGAVEGRTNAAATFFSVSVVLFSAGGTEVMAAAPWASPETTNEDNNSASM